ncbi:MAG: 2-C-methyl-D-erythritol 4-phosphate cytidylyltransferase [Gaiellaceae bacterium]|jgi:2-C-methyl-D-erythritol 4-phosphate cytidylyltransferase|nr:2-C-methyl-D-erythritol 4-phosphate cytidylyltransferase [Gaiellaceae bacterium]
MRALETWVIVVAAGMGERLGSDRPKAFVKFGERTLVAASLETFEEHDGVDGIVVAVPPGFETDMSLIADDIGAGKIAAAVPGGATRAESVANALQCLPDSAHFVLVHDAARPLVDEALIDRVMHGLAEGADGVVPALPVTDTVKRVGPDGAVSETFDRASLRAVQTPQGFPVERLRAAIAAAAGELATATDCASLVEAAGGRVVCVEGDPRNLKVTTPEDLARALELAG